MSEPMLPDRARVVVVGGGVIGTSVAYHLAHMGWKDVVLLERDRLTSGTTWHAAGLMVTFGSTSETSTELRKYTRDLYARLEAETGQATGFMPVGFIEVAADADRLEEFRRVAAFNRLCGVDVEEISPSEVKRLFPLARVDDILAGFYVRDDGRVNPVDVTMALAKGARMAGARIVEGMPVTAVLQKGGRVAGVRTARGDIEAEYVVNATGMWARQLGEEIGVTIPNQAAEHYYLITEKIPDLPPGLPVLEDPASYGYFREETGGLLVGLFEPVCAPWKVEGVPADFAFGEIEPDWDRMAPYLEKAMARVPVTIEAGIKKFFCGPESFTPDLRPIVGEAPEIENYFVAAGLNSIGILTGGGIGRLLAHWIVDGTPDMDVTAFNIDRLHRYQANPEYRRARTIESLGLVYRCHYPTLSPQTARGVKKSAVHDRLAAAGACFRDVSGWEGADWYAPPGFEPKVEKHSWGRENWFPWWEAEHRAAREGAILMDMSFMSKFLVQGRDAGRVLDRISANNVDGQPGIITYTQWLNEKGLLEADLTVSKLDEERFLVVVTDTMHRHAETWMKRHIPAEAHAFVTDVTSGYCQLNVQGPKSRALLQTLTTADFQTRRSPSAARARSTSAIARVLCIRITYVGELGYELYIPAEQAAHVYDRLVEAGKGFGLRHAGLKALASLRMEKGYRDYGHDIDNTDNAFETGLGFVRRPQEAGGFIGREAALKQKAAGPLEATAGPGAGEGPRAVALPRRDRAPQRQARRLRARRLLRPHAGRRRGPRHDRGGRADRRRLARRGPLEVDIAGRFYPAAVSLRPSYDPEMTRIKA